MSGDPLSLLWAKYDIIDRLATSAEQAGDEEAFQRAKDLLACCGQLIAKADAVTARAAMFGNRWIDQPDDPC